MVKDGQEIVKEWAMGSSERRGGNRGRAGATTQGSPERLVLMAFPVGGIRVEHPSIAEHKGRYVIVNKLLHSWNNTYTLRIAMTNDTTYVNPSDVHSPKRHWSLVQVLFDGGEATESNPSPNSLAIGRWNNDPVLAMRWNGNKENPLGNPQSRGLPTWFIIPEQHWRQILDAYKFSDDKINFARNFLELKWVYFLNHCPNPECRDYQKLVLHQYRTNELGTILEKLKRDELKFYHIICDGFWKPERQEKADLAAILEPAWAHYLNGSKKQ